MRKMKLKRSLARKTTNTTRPTLHRRRSPSSTALTRRRTQGKRRKGGWSETDRLNKSNTKLPHLILKRFMKGWRWIYEENGGEEEVRKGGRMVEGEGKSEGGRRSTPPAPMAAAVAHGSCLGKEKSKRVRGGGV